MKLWAVHAQQGTCAASKRSSIDLIEPISLLDGTGVVGFMHLSRRAFFAPRKNSLVVSSAVVLASLAAAVWISDFPHNRPTLWLIFPILISSAATIETVRSMRPRWNFYHAGVLLCLYMDLMVVSIMLFLLIYPYAQNWSL
jgi:hypothetical protein